MQKIVIINGPAGSGKDTFVGLCRDILQQYAMLVYSYSSVDEVKEIALAFGWDGVKDDKGRQLLSDVKMASVAYNDGPTKYLERMIDAAGDALIFVHIREPEEIAKLRSLHPEAIACHIQREGIAHFDNPADTRTLEVMYDAYIDNNSDLQHLCRIAVEFLHQVYPEWKENTEAVMPKIC